MEDKIVLRSGEAFYCGHCYSKIGTVKNDVFAQMILDVNHIDFEPGQQKNNGDKTICAICGEDYFKKGIKGRNMELPARQPETIN